MLASCIDQIFFICFFMKEKTLKMIYIYKFINVVIRLFAKVYIN